MKLAIPKLLQLLGMENLFDNNFIMDVITYPCRD